MHYGVTPLKIRVANIHAEADPARNTVDCAGEYLADAYCGNCVDRSAAACRTLNRQNQLSGRAESIAAVGHQDSSGVSTGAFDQDAQTRRRRNVCDNAERNLLSLQQRPLFNVQLDECFVVAARQLDLFKIAFETRPMEDIIECGAVVVRQLPRRFRRKSARQQPASKTTDSETRRLLGSEN